MTATDQRKLLEFGFMIIRADEQKLRIKVKIKAKPEWHYLPVHCESKAALRRNMDKMLEMPTIVED